MSVAAMAPGPARLRGTAADHVASGALLLVALGLLAFLALPLLALLVQSLEDAQGRFAGLANFVAYAHSPALLQSLWNSLWVSVVVTAVAVPTAFVFAYALTRSRMPGKALLRGITLVPLLAPTLLAAISLIYWFGNQGVAKGLLAAFGIEQIYGAPGIVLAQIFA
ncbi:MAG: putative 2-aminoethylphosphonate ABC transporter permease subunit, partial [Rubrivivax sp.]